MNRLKNGIAAVMLSVLLSAFFSIPAGQTVTLAAVFYLILREEA